MKPTGGPSTIDFCVVGDNSAGIREPGIVAPYSTLSRCGFLLRFQIDADVHRLDGRHTVTDPLALRQFPCGLM